MSEMFIEHQGGGTVFRLRCKVCRNFYLPGESCPECAKKPKRGPRRSARTKTRIVGALENKAMRRTFGHFQKPFEK